MLHGRLSLASKAALNAACLALAALIVPMASAATIANLYEVTVPASAATDAARNNAFAIALRAVAVRASGQRDAGDRLQTAAVGEARRYVQHFADNRDGTVRVGFDGEAIERVLAASDLPVWGRERPLTLVWLSIEEPGGQQSWLGSDATLPESRTLAQVAEQRGLPLAWPVMDMEDRQLAGALESTGDSAARLRAMAFKYRADAVLIGRARRVGGGELAVRWQLAFGDETGTTQGPLGEGVQFAADRLAALFATSATATQTIDVDVAAITDPRAYADTLNYLEGLTMVRSASVGQVEGDTVRFRLAVRGNAQILLRAIALGSKLVVQESGGGVEGAAAVAAGGPLSLRYQGLR